MVEKSIEKSLESDSIPLKNKKTNPKSRSAVITFLIIVIIVFGLMAGFLVYTNQNFEDTRGVDGAATNAPVQR